MVACVCVGMIMIMSAYSFLSRLSPVPETFRGKAQSSGTRRRRPGALSPGLGLSGLWA